MNALRLNAGFLPGEFEAATGLPFDHLDPMLERARKLDLIEAGERVVASERGHRYLDNLVQLFLPETEPMK